MKNIKIIFLYGFLLINSIHWAGVVLTALLGNIIGILIGFDQLPWFRLIVLIAEIVVVYKILNNLSEDFEIREKSLLKLMIVSIILFICARFDYYYEYSPGFCGNGLFDGSLESLFENRTRNLTIVTIIESFMLSLGIVIYILKTIKYNIT